MGVKVSMSTNPYKYSSMVLTVSVIFSMLSIGFVFLSDWNIALMFLTMCIIVGIVSIVITDKERQTKDDLETKQFMASDNKRLGINNGSES